MAFDDLRQYIAALRQSGDLVDITEEVDWDLDVGAISRRVVEEDQCSVYFDKIKDYPGHSMFAHYCPDLRSAAIALGLPADTPRRELRRVYAERTARPIPPVEVGSGPCQENVVLGDDVDLTDIPAPMLHDGDGGRFVGTWDLVVTQDPDTGATNWCASRFMLNDTRTLSGNVGRDGFQLLRTKYLPQRRPMPVAIVVGMDPLSAVAAATKLPHGSEESGLAGALRGKPVEVVKAITSDLRVPAHAEMVIEGTVLFDQIAREGPYGEYTAYRSADGDRALVVRVDAVTYRTNPIHTTDCTGFRAGSVAFSEIATANGLTKALQAKGLRVVDVNVPNDLAANLAFISVEMGGEEVAKTCLETVVERTGGVTSKVYVFDRDVDVGDMRSVMHAFAMRCHPGRGISVKREGPAKPLLPYLDREERISRSGPSVVFDCTWPPTWDRFQRVAARNFFEDIYPADVKRRALASLKDARPRRTPGGAAATSHGAISFSAPDRPEDGPRTDEPPEAFDYETFIPDLADLRLGERTIITLRSLAPGRSKYLATNVIARVATSPQGAGWHRLLVRSAVGHRDPRAYFVQILDTLPSLIPGAPFEDAYVAMQRAWAHLLTEDAAALRR